jgi:type IV pilus assembly protein PilY1
VGDVQTQEPPDEVDGGCSGDGCVVATQQPLVLLVVDSSGSTERLPRCSCSSAGCLECLPDCSAGDRNRWTHVIEALGGTLDGYRCERLERTEQNGATYDVGYFTPHFAPRGTPGDDGVLDVYRDRLRFGLATFDSMDTYLGATSLVPRTVFDLDRSASVDGLWSYNPIRALQQPIYTESGGLVGSVNYPGCSAPYYIDSGVRGPHAEQGALLMSGALDMLEVNDRIQRDLLAIRPYGGTPIAGALDDLYYYLAHDPLANAERESAMARHVVLVTDGEPDDDYRNDGCDCARESDALDRCGRPPSADGTYDEQFDPATMTCPYPTAEQAARILRCGHNELCQGGGPVERVHVVGFAVDQTEILERLDQIAIAGGGPGARFAHDAAELRAQLEAIFDEILAP